jgi:hypothetical protein
VKFSPKPLYRTINNTRRQGKVMVDDLPFPHPRTSYNAKWQKAFRPTLLSWASTWPDPYATNTQLDELVVLEMWDIIYPDIELDKEDRMATGVKLVHLVCVLFYHHNPGSYNYRLVIFYMTGVLLSGRVR